MQSIMEEMEPKPEVELSCKQHGPGPIYNIPSLTGYIGHDPSRRRQPAYSMQFLKRIDKYGDVPGPKYNINGLTNRGPANPPAYSIGKKKTREVGYTGPSPQDYEAEKCPAINHSRRPPAYSFQFRDFKKVEGSGPGPIYTLPPCLGPNLIDKKAQGAFTMGIPTKKEKWDDLPGPGHYTTDNYDVIKRRNPSYSLRCRPKDLSKWEGAPGPKYNTDFYNGRRPPMYTFGVKHSPCATIPIIEEDDE